MEVQAKGKLNWLQRNLPDGLLVDAAWLQRHGYSRSLRSKYVARGWLAQVARGVYRRASAQLPPAAEPKHLLWQQVVVSLQMLLERTFVVGGRTALELQGFAHYLSEKGPREIHLYGPETPPGWVSKLKLENRLLFHNSTKLFLGRAALRNFGAQVQSLPSYAVLETGDPSDAGLLRESWGPSEWPLTISSAERAILELLDEVPRRETFHQADVFVEGLRNLSPTRLHDLLSECRSVKVKRLFLWFAERHNHAWLKRLDRSGIDLGRGKRMLVRGGKLDRKFSITVPENLDAGG